MHITYTLCSTFMYLEHVLRFRFLEHQAFRTLHLLTVELILKYGNDILVNRGFLETNES